MQLQSHLYKTPKPQLNPLQEKLHHYTEFIDNGCMMTKKRFLARLRMSFRMDTDADFKRFYALVSETQFKSLMRSNLTITINY
jgi:hypothetical protein